MDDSERFEDGQTLISCPYNVAHTFPKFRMARHLVKCRRQHEEVAKDQLKCPFNSTHIVPRVELRYHEIECPDRDLFYTYTHRTADKQNPVLEELYRNTLKTVDVPSEENWDSEIVEVSSESNIIEKCKRNAIERGVLQSNSNETPADRKMLRQEQRNRTREKMNAEEEKKRLNLMSQSSGDDSESVGSDPSRVSSQSGYSFVTAQNTVENSLETIAKPSSSSGSVYNSRGRGKNPPTKNTLEMGFGRGRR